MVTTVTHKKTGAFARRFNGTLGDAEVIKEWAEATDVTWVPLDDNYNAAPGEEPDLSKGVSLNVVSHLGFQSADAGDWLIKDSLGVSVYTETHFKHYFEEFK